MLQQAVVVVQKVITLCWLQTYSVQNEPENLVEFKEIRKLWSSVFFWRKIHKLQFLHQWPYLSKQSMQITLYVSIAYYRLCLRL